MKLTSTRWKLFELSTESFSVSPILENRCQCPLKKVSSAATTNLPGLEDEVARLKASLGSSENKLSQADERLTYMLERLDKSIDKAMIDTRGKLM
ncbi:hypothetical protein Ddye_016164 [Dipteronia dyeriana]|uniref:Uncharacterized protein n=1 Tax=Dipteronia dyeriana TaxID=168575 RepID=A0AAD9X084_9ROSI|nr:hypothetical protein Ddye_016164 [Dipteronia dyeriana]